MSNTETNKRLEYFTFGGAVVSVMEVRYKASLSIPSKDQEIFIQGLFDEYTKAGKPENPKNG